MKRIAAFILCAIILLSSAMLPSCSEPEDPGVLMEMTTTFLKIGKADCTIIETGTHVVVIDTGESDDAPEIIEYMNSRGITYIDKLIITHYDSENVGGAVDIIAAFDIGEIIQANYKKKSEEFQSLETAAKSIGLVPRSLSFTYYFTYDQTEFTVIPAVKNRYALNKDDECSIVVAVQHGENSYIYAGGALTERMSELERIDVGQFDILKVPNFGIWCDGSAEFFSYISPTYAIISCSDKNPPDAETLTALVDAGAEILQTRNGDITITDDGVNDVTITIS